MYKRVDTCAAEFATDTAYIPTYEEECESNPTNDRPKVMVLGGGPNRIGRHRVRLLLRARLAGAARRRLRDHHGQLQPETVSTDYDTSDRLYFEPVTLEDVLEIVRIESRRA